MCGSFSKEFIMTFDNYINEFKAGIRDINEWNFCYTQNLIRCKDDLKWIKVWQACIMGSGAEQCLTFKNFNSKQDIINLYLSIGVSRYFEIG